MKRPVPGAIAAAVIAAIAVGQFYAYASAVRPPSREPAPAFSPLFARRLEVGVQNMDKPPERLYMSGFKMFEPFETPFSANPASLCLASGCLGSGCLGSACMLSACIGSSCATSKCVGSGCVVSVCGGSACVTSGCVGSACTGSTCVGSVCLATACMGSACLSCGGSEPLRTRRQG